MRESWDSLTYFANRHAGRLAPAVRLGKFHQVHAIALSFHPTLFPQRGMFSAWAGTNFTWAHCALGKGVGSQRSSESPASAVMAPPPSPPPEARRNTRP